MELFRSSERAIALDLPDVVDWMLATGCRMGEALALRYGTDGDGRPILDLDARTWEVNATVVRVDGAGLRLQPRPRTNAGWRVIALPDFAVRMLERRRAPTSADERWRAGRRTWPSLHPSPGALRDPTNVSGDLRQLLDSFECEACRRTGYQLQEDGSCVAGPGERRVRCAEGPWSWVTSHSFRKTVATRLDEAGSRRVR